MKQFFNDFADHHFGGWVIGGLSAMSFFIVVKVLANRAPDSGILGAIKAAINIA